MEAFLCLTCVDYVDVFCFIVYYFVLEPGGTQELCDKVLFILYRKVKSQSRQSNVRRIWTCANNARKSGKL